MAALLRGSYRRSIRFHRVSLRSDVGSRRATDGYRIKRNEMGRYSRRFEHDQPGKGQAHRRAQDIAIGVKKNSIPFSFA